MKIAVLDRAFTLLALALGIFVMLSAWRYGLYRNNVPGPGFFPMLAGILITSLALAVLFRDVFRKLRMSGAIDGSVITAVAGLTLLIIGFVLVAPYAGMAIAAFMMMIAIGYISEERGKRGGLFPIKIICAALVMIVVCHLLFGLLIRVPLLEGPLGF